MDRDDAGMSDRSDEARQGDTGMIGSESEDPGPGRDTSLTDPDPVAASTDQPRGTVAMSEGDPMRTRLGSHVEGAGVIGYDVAASEEGTTEETPAEDRPGYEPERSADATTTAPTAVDRDPGLATEPVVDRGAYARDAGLTGDPAVGRGEFARDAGVAGDPLVDRGEVGREPGYVGDEPVIDRRPDERTADPGLGVTAAGAGVQGGVTGVSATGPGVAAADERVDDAGPSDRSLFADEPVTPAPDRSVFATEDAGAADRSTIADDPARFGTGGATETPGTTAPAGYEGEPGGAGMPRYDEEPERLDRPGPQEPGAQEGVYDQEADRDRRPSDGV
jgi:hypothetical protein